jgi:hypothetical protein
MLEEQIVEAIKVELERQTANKPADTSIDTTKGFRVDSVIDLDSRAMAIAGSVAGGP